MTYGPDREGSGTFPSRSRDGRPIIRSRKFVRDCGKLTPECVAHLEKAVREVFLEEAAYGHSHRTHPLHSGNLRKRYRYLGERENVRTSRINGAMRLVWADEGTKIIILHVLSHSEIYTKSF